MSGAGALSFAFSVQGNKGTEGGGEAVSASRFHTPEPITSHQVPLSRLPLSRRPSARQMSRKAHQPLAWSLVATTALTVALWVAPPSQAVAQSTDLSVDTTIPALLSADQVTYEEQLGVVSASGNVEIVHQDRVLMADSISYNMKTDVVTATGNISLMEPSGDVVFAEHVELTGDLKEGVVREIRVLMTDNSRLAAASGVRAQDNVSTFNRAVFSPCDLCKEDPYKAPLWQLKARKVTHDQVDQEIRYNDVTLEFGGVPVMYSPYFYHPDPTVERKSGLLAPSFGSSDFLGYSLATPYYWAIDETQDATITPRFTTKQNIQVLGEYRKLFENGFADVVGSGTVADRVEDDGSTTKDKFRGHIDANAIFDIDDVWRVGGELNGATDKNYLRTYDISNESRLTSRLYAEAFEGRNYFSANTFAYQTLRVDEDQDLQPLVLPLLDASYISDPGFANSFFSIDGNVASLTRQQGRDASRASVLGAWELPYTSRYGDVYRLKLQAQGDVAYSNGSDPNSDSIDPSNPQGRETTARLHPQAILNWRYPWEAQGESIQQIIEPQAQVVIGPNGGNPGEIANEDSRDFEFDDTNLFSANRFAGYDRVDPGQRIDYALKYAFTTNSGLYSEAFVGQSYRFSEDDIFVPGSGLEDNLSDVVGRLYLKPIDELDLSYRFRLDKDDLSHRRAEVTATGGVPALRLGINYLYLQDAISGSTSSTATDQKEEITVGATSQLSRFWSVKASLQRDLELNKNLKARVGFLYQDECFLLDFTVERKDFDAAEVQSDTSFMVRIGLKHLGELGNS
ncbi:LPS-assembly protein LptD [Rhodovibrionaceae bacterium A322]